MGNARRLAAREGVVSYVHISLILFKLGKATARFAHWSHAGWGFKDWNRLALIFKLIFGEKLLVS